MATIMSIECALIQIDRIHMECALNRFAFNVNWANPPLEVNCK